MIIYDNIICQEVAKLPIWDASALPLCQALEARMAERLQALGIFFATVEYCGNQKTALRHPTDSNSSGYQLRQARVNRADGDDPESVLWRKEHERSSQEPMLKIG